jgi:hypothetical protein
MKKASDVYSKYFCGGDLFGKLFNTSALNSGIYHKFICLDNFTYDSDVFNHALSSFVKKYNYSGSFYITTDNPEQSNFLVLNSFDEDFLNAGVEKNIEVAKYVHSYIFDTDNNWCIYLDNDLDCFILWCDNSLEDYLTETIIKVDKSYFEEKNDTIFLQTVINRLSYKRDFDFEYLRDLVLANNEELFTS